MTFVLSATLWLNNGSRYHNRTPTVEIDYLDDNQDYPSIHDMSVEEIEEIMKKSDTAFWQAVRGEI